MSSSIESLDKLGKQGSLTTEGTEDHRGNRIPQRLAENARRMGRAESDTGSEIQNPHFWQRRPEMGHPGQNQNPHPVAENATKVGQSQPSGTGHPASIEEGHDFPCLPAYATEEALAQYEAASYEQERLRRIYRGRTVAMLRRYMQYSLDTGRVPSLLGREFFRTQVTSYTVTTFEDRVIFVHDIERCLEQLDEFSQQLIARHILQEHDRWATARLLHVNEKTVRRLTPMALDVLSEILLERRLMEAVEVVVENSCQGGKEGPFSVSDCEDGENKF